MSFQDDIVFVQRPFFLSGPPNLGVPRLYPPNKLCGPCFRWNPSAEPSSKQLGGWATETFDRSRAFKTLFSKASSSSFWPFPKLVKQSGGQLYGCLSSHLTAFPEQSKPPASESGTPLEIPHNAAGHLEISPTSIATPHPASSNGILQQHAFLNRCLACIPREPPAGRILAPASPQCARNTTHPNFAFLHTREL
jgi:hypothetical protein